MSTQRERMNDEVRRNQQDYNIRFLGARARHAVDREAADQSARTDNAHAALVQLLLDVLTTAARGTDPNVFGATPLAALAEVCAQFVETNR